MAAVTWRLENWTCDGKVAGLIPGVKRSWLKCPEARHLIPNCSPGVMPRAAHCAGHVCSLPPLSVSTYWVKCGGIIHSGKLKKDLYIMWKHLWKVGRYFHFHCHRRAENSCTFKSGFTLSLCCQLNKHSRE